MFFTLKLAWFIRGIFIICFILSLLYYYNSNEIIPWTLTKKQSLVKHAWRIVMLKSHEFSIYYNKCFYNKKFGFSQNLEYVIFKSRVLDRLYLIHWFDHFLLYKTRIMSLFVIYTLTYITYTHSVILLFV